MHMSLLGIMLLWQPEEDSMYLIFLLAGSLGAVDAIWQTQMCSKLVDGCGVLKCDLGE